MTNWQIAIACMLAYLVFAFAVGIMAGRRRSFFSVSEYAVADRGLGLFIMWFLMGGTIFSAFAFLGAPGWAFERGAAVFYIITYAGLGLLPWYILGPKVARLGAARGYFTIGDLLRDRYNSKALVVIVGIVSVLAFIQYLTIQIKGMAFVFNILTDGHIPIWLGALLAYGIVVAYVATSGVRGAAWSDVLQGILMLVVAWSLGFYLIYTLHDGPEAMFRSIEAIKPGHLVVGGTDASVTPAFYTSIVVVSMIGFMMWPHLFMKSYTTTPKRIKLNVIAYPIFALFLVPVLFVGFSAVGVVDPSALNSKDEVLPHLITNVIEVPALVYGLIGAGALAAAMSSSDAITHGASVSVGRDIVVPLKPDMAERTQIWIMRAAVVGVGAGAYCLAIFGGQGLIALLLGAYGAIVQFAPSVYGALWWKRGTRAGAIAGLVVGVGANYFFEIFKGQVGLPFGLFPGALGLIANIVVYYLVSHYTRAEDENHVKIFVNA